MGYSNNTLSITTADDESNGKRRRLLVFTDFEDGSALWIDANDYSIYKKVMYACKVRNDDEKKKRAQKYICTDRVKGRIWKLVLPGAFSSSLPESISGLTSLTTLILCSEDLRSSRNLSRSVCRLKNLNVLHANHLGGLPYEIGDLYNLTTLYLGKTFISTLPQSIGRLKNLKELLIEGNCGRSWGVLRALPAEIGDLSSLIILHIKATQIESLPQSIGRLKNLLEFNLHNSRYLQDLPEEIGDLSSLEILNLSYSKITSLPRSIGRLRNLLKLDLEDIANLRSLPVEIGDLRLLKRLHYTHDLFERARLFPKQFIYDVAVRRAMLIDPKSLCSDKNKSCEIIWKLFPKLLVKCQEGSNKFGFNFERELYGQTICFDQRSVNRIYWFLSHQTELFIQALLSREASSIHHQEKTCILPIVNRRFFWLEGLKSKFR